MLRCKMNAASKRPTILVLAAGQSRRFGASGHKLSQPFGTDSMLAATLRQARATTWPLVVVTTPALVAAVVPWVTGRDLVVLGAEEAERGMGHSIAAGVLAHADADGWLMLPADMPLVQTASIVAVGRALADHALTYAQYRGRRGHPVGFAAELCSELVALTGDEGARRLLARYPSFGVDVDDPGVLMDVDTVDDLAAARSFAGV